MLMFQDPRKLNMKNCKPTQYQPKSQILFHKNIRLYIMTLILSMLYIWTIARFYQFYISIFTSLHRTIAFQKRYIHDINFKNVPIPSCIHKSIPNHKDFPEILWKLQLMIKCTDYRRPMKLLFVETQNFWAWADKLQVIWAIFSRTISTSDHISSFTERPLHENSPNKSRAGLL